MLEQKIRKWVQDISKKGSLPEACQAIYIGIFETQTTYMLHFLGSIEFDPDDELSFSPTYSAD